MRRAVLTASVLLACNGSTPGATEGPAAIAEGDVLRFDRVDVVRIAPAGRVSLVLRGASTEEVRVWLEGSYGDGFLDRAAFPLQDGRGEVLLVAPTTPSTFVIRARQGANLTRLEVNVSPTGTATLRVTPKYGGNRPYLKVAANVFLSRTCDVGQDAEPVASAEAAGGRVIELSNVPAQLALAVSVRIERYATGCIPVPALEADSLRAIDVPLLDEDLTLDAPSDLDLALAPTSSELLAWRAALAPAGSAWLDAFVPPSTNEAQWLLDAMTAAATAVSSGAGVEFATKRTSASWDGPTTTWLGAHAPTLRARTTSVIDASLSKPPSPLSMGITPGSTPHQLVVTPKTFAKRPIDGQWVAAPTLFFWSADPNDVLGIEGLLTLRAGSLIALGADVAAGGDAGVADLAAHLATKLDCDGLAQSLVGAGVSYTGCDASCTADLCRAGVRTRMAEATSTVDAARDILQLSVTSTSNVAVGPNADVLSFDGRWVGTLTVTNTNKVTVSGTLTGKTP